MNAKRWLLTILPWAVALTAQPAAGNEPNVLFGFGTLPCVAFVSAEESGEVAKAVSLPAFAWAQGWLSARNVVGHVGNPLTVGGTLSARTLEAMLVDQCKREPAKTQLWVAADDLYQSLAAKGM